MKHILITGGSGFIGSTLADRALSDGYKVTAIDNFDPFYDKSIKQKNIVQALGNPNYSFIEESMSNTDAVCAKLTGNIDIIVHLAAKAGVRYSISHPIDYTETNVNGTVKVCELARRLNVGKIIFSSSSSVYGNNPHTPWSENLELMPQSPYAQTKALSEKYLKDFSEESNIDVLVFRFFSVYGPRMRPDLMMSRMANCIFSGERLKIFGDGSASRDYTYIDGIVESVMRGIETDCGRHEVLNVGSGNPISLKELISIFEDITGKKLLCEYVERIKEESSATWSDSSRLQRILGYRPSMRIEDGVKRFIEWYKRKQLTMNNG